MKQKRVWIAAVVVLVLAVLAFAGYNIYRYPAMFRNLTDNSLDAPQVEELREDILSRPEKKILVAYFSYSGTTRTVANAISERTGGDLFEIAVQDGYSNVYTESNREIRKDERPALKDTVEHMDEYDIVFVGYPVWWHATPAPISTFLESYDLTGKLIIPFCTSGGSDIEETMPTFLNSCEGLAVYGGRRISGTDQVDGWISDLGLEGTGSTLIAYFSWSPSGNTEKMASYIQEQIGGDLLELEPLNPYPTDYEECGDVALAERDENARPEIANLPDSLEQYDTIFVGYPIWWHTAPMIIGTFLENYDLTGVQIYPFAQSASMDEEQFENSMDFVRESAAGANVHDGLFAASSDTEGILAYLTEQGLTE